MVKLKITEHQIQKSIIDYLQFQENAGKLVFIRNNSFSGQIIRGNKTMGYIKNNKVGAADIIVLKRNIAYALEVKSETGKQSLEQQDFEIKWCVAGGVYKVVRSLEEVISLLK